MKKIVQTLKENLGLILCLLFFAVFIGVTNLLKPHFDGGMWFMVSSLQRLIFGVLELIAFIKLYKHTSVKEVINLNNWKKGVLAGSGIILLMLFYVVYLLAAVKTFKNTTLFTLIACLLLQQLATGFWEELTFRGFGLESYFAFGRQSVRRRLLYAFITATIFGLGHAVGYSSFSSALIRFALTGTMGLAFASIYLYSHNILIPMLIHFLYDILANTTNFIEEWSRTPFFRFLDNYVFYAVMAVVFVLSIVFIVKGDRKEKACSV